MSNFTGYGTLDADGNGDWVDVRGWSTLTAHYDSGSGTITWQFMGPDGVARTIYSGSSGTTAQTFTGTHMVNIHFGGDVKVRASLSGSSSPTIDWQIIGNVRNRE